MLNTYENYIHKSRYARYLPEDGRRETWEETVDRYITFFKGVVPEGTKVPWKKLRDAIYNREVMPSMRAMMTAGPALERDNVAGYNCAYIAVDNLRAFDEIMYILLCGTGVGFSVERQFINRLPDIAEDFYDVDTVIKVRDSKIGWASAYRQLIGLLYQGQIPRWDLSNIRPEGAPLKTFGGRASGPGPLESLFKFTISVFREAKGRRLNSLEVHDVICKTAEVVVCGGVRRSALLSLSNLTDERLRHAKDGEFYHAHPHRGLANNSVCYTEKPDVGIFMREWESLYSSRSGERGIFNRVASQAMCPDRRDEGWEFGTNPCSEIVLRSKQFCNLTEIVLRPDDTLADIKRKAEIATILGTLQATLTDFRYLSAAWKRNTEEERLLGVSLTGIMDHEFLNGEIDGIYGELGPTLTELKDHVIRTNKLWAKRLDIPQSTATTCVKPSGTVSQLCSTSSGIHPRYSNFYIRRVRASALDPLSVRLRDSGIPVENSIGNDSEVVFEFPIKSPDGARTVDQVSALDQLELWKLYAVHWCEHKPSCSVYVREDEWLKVGAWVYENWDICNGISFFPYDGHVYQQAPYEPISEAVFKEKEASYKALSVDLEVMEGYDMTTSSQELACTAGECEL